MSLDVLPLEDKPGDVRLCYVAKPPLSDDLDCIVGRINDFSLRYSKLPEIATD